MHIHILDQSVLSVGDAIIMREYALHRKAYILLLMIHETLLKERLNKKRYNYRVVLFKRFCALVEEVRGLKVDPQKHLEEARYLDNGLMDPDIIPWDADKLHEVCLEHSSHWNGPCKECNC